MHNFMDTFITELFSTNYDYPQNKISMWRNKSEGSKWRWILKDLDYTGFHKPVTYNMFDYMFQTGEPESDEYYDSTYDGNIAICQQLYKKMMSFSEFREMFINHFVVYLGDFLRPSITKKTIMEMTEEQKKISTSLKFWEMQERKKKQVERWLKLPLMSNEEVEEMMANREFFQKKHS